MKKSQQVEGVEYGPHHSTKNKSRIMLFSPVFDFGDFTQSELDEIQEHMTLEAYALSEKIKERDKLLFKARKWDARRNFDVIQVKAWSKGDKMEVMRFHGLEDALRSMLYGEQYLYCLRSEWVLKVAYKDTSWALKQIRKTERIYPELNKVKYSIEYLRAIQRSEWVKPIGAQWQYEKYDEDESDPEDAWREEAHFINEEDSSQESRTDTEEDSQNTQAQDIRYKL